MMTSLPLAALFITHITCAWGFITMLTQIPSFFHMALGISVEMVI